MMVVMENSILSFNEAGKYPIDFVEFDVQGNMLEKRVTNLSLEELLSYGPQTEPTKVKKSLFRKLKDGIIFNWNVDVDAPLCTLQQGFQWVDYHLVTFELKFDDNLAYKDLIQDLQTILQVVFELANERAIIFSSFQPDPAPLMRKLQSVYPVFFLTNAGNEICIDARRNSLDEAIRLCLASGLQGVATEVRSVFRNPSLIPRIKVSNLAVMTYGQLNVPEAVYMRHLMGINGVIVDLVHEISEAFSQ